MINSHPDRSDRSRFTESRNFRNLSQKFDIVRSLHATSMLVCNIILKNDDTGIQQMYTEGNEIFGDNAIVEFRYEIDNESGWRWIPIRVRYDKTSENAYRTANNNWHSIHNPITEEMLCTGNNIPEEVIDDDVYYNNLKQYNVNYLNIKFDKNKYIENLIIRINESKTLKSKLNKNNSEEI